MKTMYQVTCRNRDGLRVMITPNQGRHMHETRAKADDWMESFLENNTTERLSNVYGPRSLGTFRVDAFECYDHGDAVGIYVDE